MPHAFDEREQQCEDRRCVGSSARSSARGKRRHHRDQGQERMLTDRIHKCGLRPGERDTAHRDEHAEEHQAVGAARQRRALDAGPDLSGRGLSYEKPMGLENSVGDLVGTTLE